MLEDGFGEVWAGKPFTPLVVGDLWIQRYD
jgi:hypothetical protein